MIRVGLDWGREVRVVKCMAFGVKSDGGLSLASAQGNVYVYVCTVC